MNLCDSIVAFLRAMRVVHSYWHGGELLLADPSLAQIYGRLGLGIDLEVGRSRIYHRNLDASRRLSGLCRHRPAYVMVHVRRYVSLSAICVSLADRMSYRPAILVRRVFSVREVPPETVANNFELIKRGNTTQCLPDDCEGCRFTLQGGKSIPQSMQEQLRGFS